MEIDVKQRASRSGPSTGCGKPAKHLALQNRRCAQKLGKLCLRGEVGPTQPSQEEAATLTRENNGSPAAIGGKSSADVVQMWCTAPLDAPRGADFSPSHGRDLDFLWSGRRDSNPRPSPWQGDLAQLCHQPLHTFSNVLLGF